MPQYMITYLGGDKPSGPAEGKQICQNIALDYLHWATRQLVLLIRMIQALK